MIYILSMLGMGREGDEMDMCVMQGGKKVKRRKDLKDTEGCKEGNRMHWLRKDEDIKRVQDGV